jgi:hypothetical protein
MFCSKKQEEIIIVCTSHWPRTAEGPRCMARLKPCSHAFTISKYMLEIPCTLLKRSEVLRGVTGCLPLPGDVNLHFLALSRLDPIPYLIYRFGCYKKCTFWLIEARVSVIM